MQLLIKELEALFYKLSLYIIDNRLSKSIDGAKNQAIDIKQYLSDHLNDHILKQQELEGAFSVPIEDRISGFKERRHSSAKEFPSLVGKMFEHATNTTIHAELHHGIARKLKKAIKEHVHEAVRYSHLKDEALTSLHLEIANNAMKEIAHYLGEQDFDDLKEEIYEMMDKIIVS